MKKVKLILNCEGFDAIELNVPPRKLKDLQTLCESSFSSPAKTMNLSYFSYAHCKFCTIESDIGYT